ncbi:hypothetical protein HRR90_008747 [Exophiala dermatitidis]|uniref:Salicylate hydroxylase n=2 Tax=Exophiala dermatitidis TaxID=5970 RepID=H6C9A3_EXODN|nr:salicylate hydroxylase [Exophiala dermatitidis NIH/UT8656]XP_009160327.1 salicylate hydroxylase, variant [Exophiala dermatitidis NIH/UT8656]KAJ4502409.1 hypothetical protein HRR73_009480 [Exophiala dermatitidis]EHY59865.1 salicylate hydroxylase, variant [Exophiala dermatitidis NIH/UT8656]EHY59866.1 salicylate hydroxylase [Exophiala dermatitidis NIH/UT8656]KAJ4502906.1 hypothetical protein HRR74_009446 [Exophiala dermatitidis]KAJ4530367.1 hypothetical protein HRR76_008085 [Exophiala dermati
MPAQQPLDVAIIGAGPAGLAAAIEFAKLPYVRWRLYEQATAIREIGAGISIQRNTWRILDVLGASKNFDPKDYFRAPDHHSVQHRNGRTGELLVSHNQLDTPPQHLHARTRRSVLQNALLKEVDLSHVRLKSRLVKIERQANGRLRLMFEDGFEDEVDLVVGADGVRSVVRSFAFPQHKITYTGRKAFRSLVSYEKMATIPNVPNAVTFWQGPHSWLYTCPLGSNTYEITTMVTEPDPRESQVSWGQDATVDQVTPYFEDFAQIVKDIITLTPEVRQYALFAGPRLNTVVAQGSVALVGDASHPLSGAFGAGAGFALEDVFVLTRAIDWAHARGLALADALKLFDEVRSPHYRSLYDILEKFAKTEASLRDMNPPPTFDEAVRVIVDNNWGYDHSWMYHYDVQKVWQEAVQAEDRRRANGGTVQSARL